MATMSKDWTGEETFPVKRFHHVEFYVGNAKQALHYYRSALGFEPLAYRGPETGSKELVSYVLKQNDLRVVLTTPLTSTHPAAEWLRRRGDSVHNIAIEVSDPEEAFALGLRRGAREAFAPRTLKDSDGTLRISGFSVFGGVTHTLVDPSDYRGIWAPGFRELTLPPVAAQNPRLLNFDHMVGNVGVGEMETWSRYYEKVFGFMTFVEFDESDISTRYSALKSRVVRSRNWNVKLPLNEPAQGLRKSQIQEFLDYNDGPGIQHIALRTDDIVSTITALRANGVEFLRVPDAYYDDLSRRVGTIKEDLDAIRKLNILVDRDQEGYLLQLFTKPIEDRPTFFYEIIQRQGALGFGQGNFQALFEAIEREQELRGNL